MLDKTNGKLMLSDTAYSVGKKLVQVIIPAFSTLYFSLGAIWGLPAVEQVVGTAACLATFGGVCLGLSSKQYDTSGAALQKLEDATVHDGQMVVEQNADGKQTFNLELNGDPQDLVGKSSVSFKVTSPHI